MGIKQEVQSIDEFQSFAAKHDFTAVFFWAPWSEPSTLLNEAVDELLEEHKDLHCAKVDVDKVPAISSHLQVASVPTVAFLHKGNVSSKVEGFDPGKLFEEAESLVSSKPVDINTRLKEITTREPVMLFMKGSPDAPRCGFSRKVVEALRQANISFGHFDILEDEEVRQGLKVYSDWPTYPQLYGDGELVGGCDIILELAMRGELADSLPDAAKTGKEVPLDDRIKHLLASAPILLMMKGTPEHPRCGFSSRVVQALQQTGLTFKTFDILEDEEIRQGVKKYSDWPTYPQLYVKSELVGGCDIIMELAGKNELKSTIEDELRAQ